MDVHNRLYVLPPSHYCERARWGLDHAGVGYDEVAWPALIHIPLARRKATTSSLPILETGGTVIQGSGAILDWLTLDRGDPDLERRFETRIGVLVRQFVYAATLSEPASGVGDVQFEGVSRGLRTVAAAAWPLTRRLMVRAMQASPGHLAGAQAALDAELDWFDQVAEGRRHLVGDSLGQADITAASLLSPLLQPVTVPLYQRITFAPAVRAVLDRWNQRPSLVLAAGLYAARRPASVKASSPVAG